MNRHIDFVRKHPSFNGKPWWLIINRHNGEIIADVFKHTKWDRFVFDLNCKEVTK